MLKNKKSFLLIFALIVSSIAIAQTTEVVKDEGFMRSEGKIYVVMAVVLTILAGLFFYITRLDRKISKLEKGESL